MSPASLPPAELVFDKLLKRDKFVEHPAGISSLFFAFADLIIHNIFSTDHSSPGYTINNASSYLDLSPLYGTSQEAVNRVRLNDGTGRLKEDVFADPRLLSMPPAVCALVVIFNRNHNVSLPDTFLPVVRLLQCVESMWRKKSSPLTRTRTSWIHRPVMKPFVMLKTRRYFNVLAW
jgi:hypothetical protein